MKHRIASQEAIPFVDRLQADDIEDRDGQQLPGLPCPIRPASGSAVFGEGGFEYAPRRETGDVVVHECPQGYGEAGLGLEKGNGDEGDRTLNPRLAKAVLSQLSYVPGFLWNARAKIRTWDLYLIRVAL